MILRAIEGQIISKPGTGVYVEELNAWVYQNKGFRKNRDYFHLPILGPTPRQVLEQGGDCADKSRLLSTILRLRGVESTLVTLLGCADCGPTHVVVEARYQDGWMVADPVFDLVFPKGEFTYHGVNDLRSDESILTTRLDELVRLQGPLAKLGKYRRRTETYTYAQYLNWNKIPGVKLIAPHLEDWNIDLGEVRRPWFLEDPQFLLAAGSASLGALFSGASLVLWMLPLGRGRAGSMRPAEAGLEREVGYTQPTRKTTNEVR